MQEETEKKNYGILECENKFLHLFGYHTIESNVANYYYIIDGENRNVGYIWYKKSQNQNVKKNESVRYRYVMEIDSPLIKCKRSRRDKTLLTNYSFFLKRNGHEEPVKLCLGENPNIEIWDKEYGYMSFGISFAELHCEFQSETKKYNFKELLNVNVSDCHQKYTNFLDFWEKSKRKDISSFHFSFEKDYFKSEIQVEETFLNKGEVVSRDIMEASGVTTFEDVFKKYNLKEGSLERFQILIDEILPLPKSLIASLLEIVGGLSPEIALFFSILDKDKDMAREKKL